MARLMQVKSGQGCLLLWPDWFPSSSVTRVRGREGYVLDLDAPGESAFVAGQEHKLEPAPEGAVPSPADHPAARKYVRELAANAALMDSASELPAEGPAPTAGPDSLEVKPKARRVKGAA